MDPKIKITLAVFAVLCFLYIIHFSISYVNTEKKKENRETFEDDSTKPTPNYQTGLKVLEMIDSAQTQFGLDKKQKAEVVSRMFSNMDELQGKDPSFIKTRLDQTAKDVLDNKPSASSTATSPSSSSTPPLNTPPATPATPATPPTSTGNSGGSGSSSSIPPPPTPTPPTGGSESVPPPNNASSTVPPPVSPPDRMLPKLIEIQSHLSTAQSLIDDIKLMNKSTAAATASKTETFQVEGFENNVRFSNFL
jgi:hypothetical protein